MKSNHSLNGLKLMVYIMGYAMVFGMFFICYVLYQQNALLSKNPQRCINYKLQVEDKIISSFSHQGEIIFIGEAIGGKHSLYKLPPNCQGDLLNMGEISNNKQ